MSIESYRLSKNAACYEKINEAYVAMTIWSAPAEPGVPGGAAPLGWQRSGDGALDES